MGTGVSDPDRNPAGNPDDVTAVLSERGAVVVFPGNPAGVLDGLGSGGLGVSDGKKDVAHATVL